MYKRFKMKSVQLDLNNIKPVCDNLSICLGYFDGVHLGHKKLISFAKDNAKYPLGLLTFSCPVSEFIPNQKSKEIITSLTDRFRIISRFNLDYYFVLHINKDFLNYSSFEFIELLKKLNVKEIFIGNDYRYGKDRSGTIELLNEHFIVHVVDMVLENNEKISTQQIISLLKNGEIIEANHLLGQHYQMCGTIVEGHHNGEKFGIRTANVKLDANYVIPKYGVYKVIAYIDGVPYRAIANIGVHPSIDEEKKPLLEVHIPNYNSLDYGKNIYVEFLDFVRPERKFANTDELIKQIKKDIELVK